MISQTLNKNTGGLKSKGQVSKITTVHIHTDYKFVNNSQRFEGKYFDNTIIIFRKDEPYQGPYKDSAKYFDRDEVDKVIELCEKADLVVLYDLGVLKSIIALALPDDITISWRFFGYELYKGLDHKILSKKSLALVPENKSAKTFLQFIKNLLGPIYYKLRYGDLPNDLFHKAIKRVDYILMISKLEYEYLSPHWENLPECIELSVGIGLFSDDFQQPDIAGKDDIIVVGNSRSINNNHLDVIDMIDKADKKDRYQFELLFNYGSEGEYTNAVRRAVEGKSYFRLIEDFMPKEVFNTFYFNKSALVINSYRQMAMGNILHALENGVKVYLNKKNVMMQWLLENGIEVFPVDSLVTDIEEGNIRLDENTAKENCRCLKDFCNNYSHEVFQENIYKKVSMNEG